jgi:hypothetical protein
MAEKLIWTGLYLGVCRVNKKHRFHCDSLGPMRRGDDRTGRSITVTKACCGQPVNFVKVIAGKPVKNAG